MVHLHETIELDNFSCVVMDLVNERRNKQVMELASLSKVSHCGQACVRGNPEWRPRRKKKHCEKLRICILDCLETTRFWRY